MSSGRSSPAQKAGLEWAIQTIQELSPSEESLFTRWLDISTSDAESTDKAGFIHIVLRTGNIRKNIDAALPDWLSAAQRQSIAELLHGDCNNKLGVISGNMAVLWMDTPRGTANGRLMLLGLQLIESVVGEIYPQVRLTRSELRTLIQLMLGNTLQEAAALDSVGYETKRSQLKAVFSKTGTSRQTEITAVLLSHILVNFGSETYREKTNDTNEVFYHYIRNCLPEATRHHILVNESGAQTRFIDVGPIDGTPLIFLHHLGILYFTPDEVQMLEDRNMRFIYPLRNGALSVKDEPLLLGQHMEHALEGIRMTQQMFCGERATLVCPLSSCFYGLEYVRAHSNAIKDIVFIGAAYKEGEQKTAASAFRNYFFGIALKNTWLLEQLLRYLGQQTKQMDAIKNLFEKAYSDSPEDMKMLERNSTIQRLLTHSSID